MLTWIRKTFPSCAFWQIDVSCEFLGKKFLVKHRFLFKIFVLFTPLSSGPPSLFFAVFAHGDS